MNQVLFISESKLKQNSDVLENVDALYIRNSILKIQRTKCLPILGSDLYNQISNMIVNNTISLPQNSVYKNMLDNELQQSVIYFATADILLSLSFKITTKGVLQFANENSTAAPLDTIKFLTQRYEDTGDYWLVRLRNYCEEFSKRNELPEYTNPNYNDDRTIGPDQRTPWYNQIYLKGYLNSKDYWRRQDNLPNNTQPQQP